MPAINLTDLNNAKLDVDHIAAIATSPGPSATDRFGNTKLTIAALLAALPNSGVAGFETLAALNADLNYRAGVVAFVTNDPLIENNTTYRKLGASGSGSWAAASTSADARFQAQIAKLADGLGLEAQNRINLLYKGPAGGALLADLAEVYDDEIPGAARAWLDESDRLAAQITPAGCFEYAAADTPTLQTGLRAELCHILNVSQSWGGGTGGAPALTTAARANILMFAGGVRPKDVLAAPDCYASLVGAVESNNAGDVRGETPLSGFARGMADAILADEGVSLAAAGVDLLISAVAPGGTALSRFVRNGTYFVEAMEQVTAAYARAQERGQTYRLLCCPFIIGKGDYDLGEVSKAAFKTALAYLIADLNAAVKALIPDHPDTPFLVYQTGSHGHASRQPTIDLALAELDRENPLVIFAGLLTAYPRNSTDTVHFSNASYQAIGKVGGILAKRYLFTGAKPAVMLPVEFNAQGRVISVRFRPPALPLVLDAGAANAPANHGLELLDSLGAPLAINSIAAMHDRIVVVAAAALPAGWQLRYAFSGAYAAGQVSGPRGAIRDSSAVPNWSGLFQLSR